MRRVVSVFLPTWPTDRLRRQAVAALPAEQPLVLAVRDGGRRGVFAANVAARAAGLHAGMPLARAQALLLDLIIKQAGPEGNAAAMILKTLHKAVPIIGNCGF